MVDELYHHAVEILHGSGEIEVEIVVLKEAVRYRLKRHELHAVAHTNLCGGASLHLAQQRVEGISDPAGAVAIHGKPVTGSHEARAIGHTHLVHSGLGLVKIRSGEGDAVNGRYQTHGVANVAGIHVVLQESFCQYKITDLGEEVLALEIKRIERLYNIAKGETK